MKCYGSLAQLATASSVAINTPTTTAAALAVSMLASAGNTRRPQEQRSAEQNFYPVSISIVNLQKQSVTERKARRQKATFSFLGPFFLAQLTSRQPGDNPGGLRPCTVSTLQTCHKGLDNV